MRRTSLRLLAAILLIAILAWWIAPRAATPGVTARRPEPTPLARSVAAAPARTPAPPMVVQRAAVALRSPSVREQQAFRFVLSDGKLTLEAVEEIRGDFHPPRAAPAWEAGMFCCRLLDARQRVVAEETLPAPDHVCVVLDPNTPGPDGRPQAVEFSPRGPVVFQVRMPSLATATQLKVYRLAGSRPAMLDAEPAGQLLASIPLTR